jgi:hypothetical protein
MRTFTGTSSSPLQDDDITRWLPTVDSEDPRDLFGFPGVNDIESMFRKLEASLAVDEENFG